MLQSFGPAPRRLSSKGDSSSLGERSCCLGRSLWTGARVHIWTGAWRRRRRCLRSVTALLICTASTSTSRCCTRPRNVTRSTASPDPTSRRSRKPGASSPL